MSTEQGNRAQRVTGHLKLIDRKRGGPTWYAKTRVPGRVPEQTTTKLAPAHLGGGRPANGTRTRKQAQDELADLLAKERAKLARGEYAEPEAIVTFGQAADGFLHHVEHVKGREHATIKDYKGSIEARLRPRWGDKSVHAITPAEVAELRDELMAEGLSNRTVVRHLTVAHGVFKYAVRTHDLRRNPASAELVDRPTVRYSGEFDTFDLDELRALERAAESGQDAALFLTAAMSGLRQGELLALRWRDLDFAGQRIHVRRSYAQHSRTVKAPKSGKVRSVPLVPELIAPLDGLSRREHFTGDDNLVFCTETGDHLDPWALRRRYARALTAAGLRRVRFHDLRHCFGSTAVREFPLSDVQAMLGHAHVTTTMRYVHHRPGADDAARLSRAFGGSTDATALVPEDAGAAA